MLALGSCLTNACSSDGSSSSSDDKPMASDGAQSDPTNDAPAPAAPNTPKPATPAPKPATPAQPTPDSPAPAPADGSTDACGNAKGQLFPPGAPWNTEISDAPLDSESDAIIDYLDANHNTGTRFQIDFGFRVLHAAAGEPHKAFTPNDDFYEGDCDPAPMPVPSGGGIEGEDGYACESDGDCHLIVVSESECRLYEMWRADIRGNDFNGGCMALWSIDKVYGPEGRGDFCTSADAAGLPITPLLFSADEVYNGEIAHAIRFILPNEHIRESIFVRPGTHSTGATSGPSDSPPYSARLRMRADADISGLSKGGQVVARALQKYGMFLADGGNLTFTGQSDQDTEHSWDEAELTPQDLKGLSWTDFEVVELGERIDYGSGSCEREPIAE